MIQNAPTAHPHIAFLNTQATLPVLAKVAVKVAVLITKWSIRQRSRKHLRRLSDAQLKDIGLTRSEAHYEATLPFWRP